PVECFEDVPRTSAPPDAGCVSLLVVHALILWDVDHTLVDNAGVSKETYGAAFAALAGFQPRTPAHTSGRTDRLIMREMFAAHHLQGPGWSAVYDALQKAGEERFAAMRERGSVLPGVWDVLAALAERPGIVQSLLTGNIKPNARMKVTASGIGEFFEFDVGGYGEDSEDRSELVPIAQRRASIAHRQAFDKNNTILIGDTPRDVEAGRRGGARVLAVASGVHSAAQLHAAGQASVLEDLQDTRQFMAVVNVLLG
ncbi:MAG: haloacid dehalogenase-like hydrolase, partial [Sciscionella sp.]